MGVRYFTDNEANARGNLFFGPYKTDLIYKGMNVKYILLFLMSNDKLLNGKLKSVIDNRKYSDAILWGAKTAGE